MTLVSRLQPGHTLVAWTEYHASFVQVGDLLVATLLNLTLARTLCQVCPLLTAGGLS
jgi:hypothetical protein